MSTPGSLDDIRMSASISYQREHGAPAREVTSKLTQNRILTNNDIDALTVLEYAAQDILQKYHAAMRQMETRLETLDQDLKLRKSRNPIHHIESRMKSVPSIAGLRVIVSYVQDSYAILEYLEHQDDLEVVTVKDYIANPKPNGYRSLHLIVKIPVYFLNGKQSIPVEIQIRTIAMDFWASLEHDLKYKSVYEIEGIDVSTELKACSQIISGVEKRMQILANALEGNKAHPKPTAVQQAKQMNLANTLETPAGVAVDMAEEAVKKPVAPVIPC